MAAWIVCALCALVLLKPQEFVPALAALPLLYILFALAVVLGAADLIKGRLRLALAPHVPLALLFFVWGLGTTAVKRPDVVEAEAIRLAIVAAVFLIVAIGAASASGLRLLAWTLLASALVVTVVGIEQGRAPFGCMLGAPDDWEGKGELTPDGRPCETALDCREDAPVLDGNYRCERVGPLGTCSIGGRVRYRGSLADPNELSLAVAIALPFAFALFERRRAGPRDRGQGPAEPAAAGRGGVRAGLPILLTDGLLGRGSALLRALPVGALIAAVGAVVVMSKSRTGVIVLLVVLGMSFVRRAGAWGLVGGSLLGPPLLLLGGREGAEAESSSDERAELIREAFEMIRGTKGVGIGVGRFTDESWLGLTAHNSYVLAAAEAGLVGLLLFSLTVYLALKVPFIVWLRRSGSDGAARMAPAIAVSLSGAAVGIFFLSWSYKDVLYILLGASAALYSAARAEDPRLTIELSLRELVLVGAASMALLGVLYVGVRMRGV